MVRRYEDLVEVRPVPEGDRPGSFLWRGRLYVVRDVLGHWRERRAWWTSPAARAVHGEGSSGSTDRSDGGAPGGAVSGSAVSAALGQEREVWRVEASRGQAHGSGVFDLCRVVEGSVPVGGFDADVGGLDVAIGAGDIGAGGGGAGGGSARRDAWRLVRVAD